MFQKISKVLIMLSLISLVLPNFCVAQQSVPIEAPESIEEGKNMAIKAAEKIVELLPGIVKKTWKEDIIPLWKKMWEWVRNFWKSYAVKTFDYVWHSNLKPAMKSSVQKVKNSFMRFMGKEVSERMPIIKEEFKKETEEMKEGLPRETETLWQRFKDLFK